MDINYDKIFEILQIPKENTTYIKENVESKLKSLEKILLKLNETEEQITSTHIRNILSLYGYKICF